jgi:hypothetical protein
MGAPPPPAPGFAPPPGAMAPPFGAPMAPPGAMMPGAMGAAGPVGETRSPVQVALISAVCGFYGLWWFYWKLMPELRANLGRNDEYNPLTQAILGVVTCGIMYFLALAKAAKMIQEAQMRAGRPNPQDKTNIIWICLAINVFLGIPAFLAVPYILQDETNKIWNPQQA